MVKSVLVRPKEAPNLAKRVLLGNGYAEDATYPVAIVNVTNRCNLHCEHCFVYRDGNPNEAESPRAEIQTDEMLAILEGLRDRHSINTMLWMGGEPLLRSDLIRRGVSIFDRSIVTTNGTIKLPDLGDQALYVISLDGPEEINDLVRGAGSYKSVKKTISRIPDGFVTPVQVQCTVTRANQDHLEELVLDLRETGIGWMTFSFYVPPSNDTSGLGWDSLEERMVAVDEVSRLKAEHPGFIRNRSRALQLMAPDSAPGVTKACLPKQFLLPLYLEGDHFRTTFCCYGDDVDCSKCGGWVVFDSAARAGSGDLVNGAPQYG